MRPLTLPTLAGLIAIGVTVPALADNPIAYANTDFTARTGALLQVQLQSNTDPVLAGTSDNFVIRRARIYAAGTVGTDVEWRLDTDDPNLGKTSSNVNGTKNLNNLYIQDALVTLLFSPAFKLDSGLLVVDPSHHATIGATRIYAWDTFTYQGLQNSPLQDANSGTQGSAPANREVGVQARGLLYGGHLEYHVALTNGYRDGANDTGALSTGTNTGSSFTAATIVPGVTTTSSNNAFRATLRAQYNFFDNEDAAYTTAGTYLGSRKIVTLSVGYDTQSSYFQRVGEIFVDLPVNNGKDIFTLEASYWNYDGGTWLPSLLKQKDFSIQTGYNFGRKWNPIIRYEERHFATPGDSALNTPVTKAAWGDAVADFNEVRESLGLAYWFHGHNANFKAFYTSVQPKNEVSTAGVNSGYRNYHQIVGQLQVYVF